MYKLLLLTDFSAASHHAITYAQSLFADTAADFCLLHTFPLQPDGAYAGAMLLADDRAAAEQSMHDLRRELTQHNVPAYHSYRAIVALGHPEGVVEELLKTERFDLIVVGATGKGNTELFGSVATGLIRQAPANLLVVPAKSRIQPLLRIVLATDYRSVNDAESLAFLSGLANRKAATITLLTIEKPDHSEPGISPLTRDYVQQALDAVKTDTYLIHDDDVLNGINTYLDLHPVDLLVLLPHHTGFWDVLTGKSVTRSMAYRPRVPLLTLHDNAQPATPPEVDSIPFATYL